MPVFLAGARGRGGGFRAEGGRRLRGRLGLVRVFPPFVRRRNICVVGRARLHGSIGAGILGYHGFDGGVEQRLGIGSRQTGIVDEQPFMRRAQRRDCLEPCIGIVARVDEQILQIPAIPFLVVVHQDPPSSGGRQLRPP
jgi:hypothetical protein